MIGILLAAGCTTQPSAPTPAIKKNSIQETPALPVASGIPVVSLVPTRCPPEITDLFINVSPTPDCYLGDTITFNGTTNLAAGENFTLGIVTASFFPCPKNIKPCRDPDTVNSVCCTGGFNRSVAILRGRCGINTWSFTVNTSQYDFWPGLYIIDMESGNISGEVFFTLLEKPKPFDLWIAVEPIPGHSLGNSITFTGTTNLPPGEIVTTRIFEARFHCTKCQRKNDSVDGCCGDQIPFTVRPGSGGINIWSRDVNTSQHGFRSDGEYFIPPSARNDTVENSSLFTVSGIPKPNLTLNLPVNDSDGNVLRFSGQDNTGNGPEEKLLLTVSSDSGRKASYTVPLFRNGTGYSWTFSLKKSDIVPYNFLTVNVSSQTSPEIRIERTFLHNNEPAYYPYSPYGP